VLELYLTTTNHCITHSSSSEEAIKALDVASNAWRAGKQTGRLFSNHSLLAPNSFQVQHAKRAQNLAYLPSYQTELVRAVTREVRDLDRDVTRILEPFQGSFNHNEDQATACALLVDHLAMRRNKRCLLAYHRVRAEKLESMCWEGKDPLERQHEQQQGDQNGSNAHAHESSLSPEEEEYFRQYNDLLASFKGQWTDIDLTGSLDPPRDLFIDVRVLKDAGEIQTEYGAINLTKNSQFYVRQGDVERLIAQGFLQKLS
jgi:GINS complex subunit 1